MSKQIITNDETWALVLFHADNDPKIVRDIDRILIDVELTKWGSQFNTSEMRK